MSTNRAFPKHGPVQECYGIKDPHTGENQCFGSAGAGAAWRELKPQVGSCICRTRNHGEDTATGDAGKSRKNRKK